MSDSNENLRLKEREAFVKAFNDTMVKIWKEKITLLGAVDTYSLLDSVVAVRMNADGKFLSLEFEQQFLEYGFYVDAGTGRETPIGNPGDIGRDKMRKPKPWFFRKHLASIYNIRDFLAQNVGQDFADTVSNALSKRLARQYAVKH